MAYRKPYCELDLDENGSINFNALEFNSDDCIIPPSLKSVNIPLSLSEKEIKKETPAVKAKVTKIAPTKEEAKPEVLYKSEIKVPTKDPVVKEPPKSDSSPEMMVAAIGAASSVASSMAMQFIQKAIKGGNNGNSSDKRKSSRSMDANSNSGDQDQGHGKCSMERNALQERIVELEDVSSSLEKDNELLSQQVNDLKKSLKDLKRVIESSSSEQEDVNIKMEEQIALLKKMRR